MLSASSKAPDTGWGPIASILITALTFLAGQFTIGILIFGIMPVLLGWDLKRTDGFIDDVFGQFIFVLLAEALTVFLIYTFLQYRKRSFRVLGFPRGLRWSDFGWGVASFVPYFIVVVAASATVGALLSVNLEQEQDLGFTSAVFMHEKLMAFVSLVVLPPVVEEIVFRGFLYGGLRRKLNFVWTALIVSTAFASLHLFGGFEGEGLLWIAGVDTFVLSIALCYLREKTGTLWAPIVLHAIKNGIAFFILYVAVS